MLIKNDLCTDFTIMTTENKAADKKIFKLRQTGSFVRN